MADFICLPGGRYLARSASGRQEALGQRQNSNWFSTCWERSQALAGLPLAVAAGAKSTKVGMLFSATTDLKVLRKSVFAGPVEMTSRVKESHEGPLSA
jgi:hypothetical protein